MFNSIQNFKKISKYSLYFITSNIIVTCGYIGLKSFSKNKLNIIFDLDETLIYSCKNTQIQNYNMSNTTKKTYSDEKYSIWLRPYVTTIIPLLSKFTNLYLMTRAKNEYTNTIITNLKIDKYFIEKKYREDCDECKNLIKFNSIKYIDKSILIDDLKTNRCENQKQYHIPRFNMYVRNDIEMIKLFINILWINIKYDFKII